MNQLLQTNNFPEFTGRVCPAPCEVCTLKLNPDLVLNLDLVLNPDLVLNSDLVLNFDVVLNTDVVMDLTLY